jgi:diphthine-ammonia ligase
MIECIKFGHKIVALANLIPPEKTDELDSFMYQTVGHQIISSYSQCLSVPLFRRTIRGKPLITSLSYKNTQNQSDDEVEDLFQLLLHVKTKMPEGFFSLSSFF